ncbi:cytochrome c [Tranquillimonas alkanivorans]|uniref:Cytochrome c, mono-and diheme variants n=1 Tax=Tranquillimonas alkanivorans TaxID=441119 RepID=A0A1I5RMU6_9RHOB|nr:cytochrome c [Tranquillimonas alkanivorans]SFP59878.1 Cytochrome c, mono-and diheme variants [Tranquillimonas alkanivorans]
MPPILRWTLALAVLGIAAGWLLTRPQGFEAAALDGVSADVAHGEQVFLAAGCASCHVAPEAEAEDGAPRVLSGGQRFASPFGTFLAPNISPHPVHGVGGWSDAELVTAIMHGVSPDGAHYYPAFPYAAYGRAEPEDILSLIAYLRTLPESDVPSQPHEVGFPFNIRRGLGLWKRLFVPEGWVVDAARTPEAARGRYLAEALAHCGECHTPRNVLGGLDTDRWLAGGPNPAGEGRIPNITPGGLDWSESDIVAYLTTGFTPEYDTAGGEMVAVIENLSQLPEADRQAIAAYLKAVSPVE